MEGGGHGSIDVEDGVDGHVVFEFAVGIFEFDFDAVDELDALFWGLDLLRGRCR
jgi:hypothetical protein